MSVLSAAYMHNEAAAFEHVESLLWPDGAVCPHCGVVDSAYKLTGVRSKPSKKNPEGKERHGLYKCKDCGKQFTVRKGTIFEESHIALHLWLQAIHLMASSKKGISSHQLARTLEITQKSAWFLAHRIREAMRDGDLSPMGGDGGVVEVDETSIGREPVDLRTNASAYGLVMPHVSVIERGLARLQDGEPLDEDFPKDKRDIAKRVLKRNSNGIGRTIINIGEDAVYEILPQKQSFPWPRSMATKTRNTITCSVPSLEKSTVP